MPLKSKLASRVAGALFATVAAVVGLNEGRSLVAYKDSAGILTICDGETLGVKAGEKRTQAQCDDTLRKGIARHATALSGLPEDLPDTVLIGAIDGVYNIGTYGFDSSSTKACLARKDYKCAGENWLRWKYITLPTGEKYDCSQLVNGTPNKVCYGLWKRRLWQSKAMSNQFKSVQELMQGMPR